MCIHESEVGGMKEMYVCYLATTITIPTLHVYLIMSGEAWHNI